MKSNSGNRPAILLIVGSLLLLVAFLVFWLTQVYQNEVDQLQQETDYQFLSAIREIEENYFQQIIVDPILEEAEKENILDIEHLRKNSEGDSLESYTIIKKSEISSEELKDSAISLTVRKFNAKEKNKRIEGSLSLFISMAEEKKWVDSVKVELADFNLLPLVDSVLQLRLSNTDLPAPYELAPLTDSLTRAAAIYSSDYIDWTSGQSFALRIPNYRMYVFRNMLPQLLFSLLLLSSVFFAFTLVYQNLRRQQRLTALKNDFISNITHELKTPITTVGVAIEALSDFNALDNPKRTQEYLDISRHELNRLSILVDKVLKMSLFEQKEPELKLESLNLGSLATDILATMKLQFEKYQARVTFKTEGEQFPVRGDRIHLTSVLYNLIDNALKYGGQQPEIEISLQESPAGVEIEVADRGMGIPAQYLDKIFDKFFRVPAGDLHNIKGHGLGLSYVAGVVEKHQGKISVDSLPGKGTRFQIHLPKEI